MFSLPQKMFCQINSGSTTKGIYVWSFKMADGKQNNFTTDIANTYQSILSESIKGFDIVDRRDLATLLAQRENELTIQQGNVKFSKDLQEFLSTKGATIAVFGTIRFSPSQGLYTVNIKFVNIFTTNIVANPQKSCEDVNFENTIKQSEFLKSMVPDLKGIIVDPIVMGSSLSTTGGIGIVRRTQLETNSEVWRYVQAAYFEEFTNWKTRKDFRSDIWNKRDDADHSCGIYFSRYLIKNRRNGFLKHKYIEDKRIGIRTDFSLAHPMSVTLHIPDTLNCFSTKECLGRGITTRFNIQKNCGYALTLNDDGEFKFFIFKNIHDPNDIEPLYSTKVNVQKGMDVEIGIISMKDEFFLYFNRKFMRVVKDNTYSTGINGIVASGKGTHWFDNINVFNQVRVN